MHNLKANSNVVTDKKATHKAKERSVFMSLVVDFLLMLPDAAAAIIANSVTLMADVLKCLNELLATLFSWIILKKISKGKTGSYDFGLGKFENLTSLLVGLIMFISFCIVLFTAFYRFYNPVSLHSGGVGLGIALMIIGVIANGSLWRKNYKVAKKEHSPIMESQWRLFRTKTFADFTILIALILCLALEHYEWSVYIDPVASLIVGLFLLFSIYGVISNSIYDLLDKTIEESYQLLILRELANHFEEYKAIYGVRSRRAGNNVYIEILLEFDGDKQMSEIQSSINAIKLAVENVIPNSNVLIAPTNAKQD